MPALLKSPQPDPLLLITMGDAAGIGPEIIAKAFALHPAEMQQCVVIGDVATMRRAAALVAASAAGGVPLLAVAQLENLKAAAAVPPRCIGVLQGCAAFTAPVPLGQISAAAGQAAADCIRWAAQAVLQGQAHGMVTAPIHKEALAAAAKAQNFNEAYFPGHTEMLQAESARHQGVAISEMPVRMMLANGELKTVLVSIHLSLRAAIEAVTHDSVLQTLRITHAALATADQPKPRIGVAGLNPHAGEGGLFGQEETAFIAPAIATAQAEGINAFGPFAPDTVFMRARNTAEHRGEFDAVVAMYHDQGLIPVKYLGVEQGVNVTLGLPMVRTSPDHGTAFDIAGTGLADASSLLAAVRLARQMCLKQAQTG